MEKISKILDLITQQSTLIVAIMGFIATIVVAKLTSSMELRKTILLKRIEAYEKALKQLTLMKNAYSDFLNSITGVIDNNLFESRITLIYASLTQLEKINQQSGDLVQISFYTDIPLNDTLPMFQKITSFMQIIIEIIKESNSQSPTTNRQQLIERINISINELRPFAKEEYQYLQSICEKLHKDIKNDKKLKKIL